jgi:GH35 family endo-1,4-beta-xylanase
MTTLGAAAAAVGIEFGFAVEYANLIAHPSYANVAVSQSAVMTDNKDIGRRVSRGVFNWTNVDALDAYINANGRRQINAGYFVTSSVPAWIEATTNTTTLRNDIDSITQTEMLRFPTVQRWVITNEVMAHWNGNPNGYRTTHWWTYLGENFVKYAFDAAAAVARPTDKLMWMDNHAIEDSADDAFDVNYAQLVRWLNEGVRIDSFGTQMHLGSDSASATQMVDRLNQIAALGLEVCVTELDIYDTGFSGTAESIKQQCADFILPRMTAICRDVPDLKTVTCWDTTDTFSWINNYLGPRGDGIPRTGNCYDRSDPPLPNPMRQALIDAFGERAPVFDVAGNVANMLTNDRATITVATPSTAIEVRFGTDVLVDHNGLALTSPGRLTDQTSATLDDQSSLALLDNEVNSLTGQTTTGSESVTLTLTGGT